MLQGQLFDEAVAIATAQGFEVRYEHLGGSGSGHCRLADRHWMVIDVAQPTDEQIDALAEAIASTALPDGMTCSKDLLARLLEYQATLRS